MKILITADLHYWERWFRWLIEQGANYDLICIAGDLLDMFNNEPRTEQAWKMSRWVRELAKVSRVAVYSGNHDNAGRQVTTDRAPIYQWFDTFRSEPKIITDGVTQVIDDLIVTTVPYHCSKEQKSIGSSVEPPSGDNAVIDGSFFVMCRQAWIHGQFLVKNPKRQLFSRLIGRTFLSPDTPTPTRILLETVGRRRLAGSMCWYLDSFCGRRSRTISF
jgi:hypothetical protein